MGLRPHDLLRISGMAALLEFRALPEWAHDSLGAWPWVVVRRARAPDGFVPVGIRGPDRSQRTAALLPLHAVEECISPEDLAARQPWLPFDSNSRAALPQGAHLLYAHRQFQALTQVAVAAQREALIWGPSGSAGFELASGAHVIREESDLDIVVRFTANTVGPGLRRFRAALVNAPVQVDILLEADGRAAALDEYLRFPHRVLIKTPDGPELGAFTG
jgi:phosphoribosyl-dephospho-CoA transferase